MPTDAAASWPPVRTEFGEVHEFEGLAELDDRVPVDFGEVYEFECLAVLDDRVRAVSR